MYTKDWVQQLLNLRPPYSVQKVQLRTEDDRPVGIDIFLTVEPEYRPRFKNANDVQFYDHEACTWQHLSIFQLPCYLHCNVPRYRLKTLRSNREYIRRIPVPFAGKKTELTSQLESYAMKLIELHGNIASVSKQLGLQPLQFKRKTG